jgi:hypothetical protein
MRRDEITRRVAQKLDTYIPEPQHPHHRDGGESVACSSVLRK